MVSIYIAYATNLWLFNADKGFVLGSFLFVAVKLTKMPFLISINILAIVLELMYVEFLLSYASGLGKNVIIFGADMSSLLHIDNKKNVCQDSW